MKWKEFLDTKIEDSSQIQTDIECPICGRKIYLNNAISLSLYYPHQYNYYCTCGWCDTAPQKWDGNKVNYSSNKGSIC